MAEYRLFFKKGSFRRLFGDKGSMIDHFECEAVLFDLDGVLVDSRRSVERVWSSWANHHGLDAARVVKVAHGRRTIETVRLFAPHLDVEAEARELEQAEIRDTEGVREVDGAATLLEALLPDSWAVVTSGTRALATARLNHTGLPIPRILVGSEDVESGKPNPECYLKGAKLLGATPERCVVVEDTPAGVEAGQAAGMKVIAVTTTHRASELSEADAVVRALSDISLERRDASAKDKPYLELLVET